MAVKKIDISQADRSLTIRDDSEMDSDVPKFLYSRAQHVNRSTYSDLPVTEVRNAKRQTWNLFSKQTEFENKYQTDEKITLENSIEGDQAQLFYFDVAPGELGQQIKSNERKKIKANLKKVNKVTQSKIDSDVANFIDL